MSSGEIEMMKSRTITVSIERSPEHVVAFVSNPEHLPAWLTFITGVRREGNRWWGEMADGLLGFEFVPPNAFGILDHRVTLSDGREVVNPMRVVPNQTGSEVIFTLFQLHGMSDEEFARDAITVETDLRMLKQVLERE
jgi:hypothetical protein